MTQPTGNRYEDKNVPGPLRMKVCQQLCDDDPTDCYGAWIDRIRVACLAGRNVRSGTCPLGAARPNHTPLIQFLQPARLFPKTATAP